MRPRLEFAEHVIFLIYPFQDRSDDRVSPRYLCEEVVVMGVPERTYMSGRTGLLHENCKHLLTLSWSSLSVYQVEMATRSFCRSAVSNEEWRWRYRAQSSANRRIWEGILFGRSLMKMRKRRGPSTKPCGMPEMTGLGTDSCEFTKHDWWWSLRKCSIHVNKLEGKPRRDNSYKSWECKMVLKASERYRNMTSVGMQRSMLHLVPCIKQAVKSCTIPSCTMALFVTAIPRFPLYTQIKRVDTLGSKMRKEVDYTVWLLPFMHHYCSSLSWWTVIGTGITLAWCSVFERKCRSLLSGILQVVAQLTNGPAVWFKILQKALDCNLFEV